MIAAFSEAIVDVLFEMGQNGPFRTALAGGGPVCNQVISIASAGVPVRLYLARGSDRLGEAIVGRYNIDNLELTSPPLKDRCTRRVFQRVKTGLFSTVSNGRLTTTCPGCKRKLTPKELPQIKPSEEWTEQAFHGCDLLLLDRLSQKTVDLAKLAKDRGLITVLDIGTGSYLRFISSSLIEQWFSTFDVIQAPEELLRKYASKRVNGALQFFKPCVALVLTRGADGCDVASGIDVCQEIAEHIPAPVVEQVVDPTGSGDALLSGALYRYLQHPARSTTPDHFYEQIVSCLRRSAEEDVPKVLSTLGARGHLQAFMPSDIVPVADDRCAICDREYDRSERRIVSMDRSVRTPIAKQNLLALESRVASALERKGLRERTQIVWDFLKRNEASTCYVIGTGGSYPAAVAISQLISKHTSATGIACRPWDYLRLAKEKASVIMVSYSASSGDIDAVLNAAREKKAERVVVVTGRSSFHAMNPVVNLTDEVLCYGRKGSPAQNFPSRERGFISISATVAPVAIFTSVAHSKDTVLDTINRAKERAAELTQLATRIAEASKSGRRLHIIGGGWAWPAMLDLEGKMTETNLMNVLLHETRDFSHGRFMSVLSRGESGFNSDPVVLFTAADPDPYEEKLKEAFSHERMVEIGTSQDNGIGSLELLVLSQFLAVRIGEELGQDISKPGRIPRAGIELYRWRPDPW